MSMSYCCCQKSLVLRLNQTRILFGRTHTSGASLDDFGRARPIGHGGPAPNSAAWRCRGPSIIDFGTLETSGTLPLKFLRGLGLSERLVDYLPSLLCWFAPQDLRIGAKTWDTIAADCGKHSDLRLR